MQLALDAAQDHRESVEASVADEANVQNAVVFMLREFARCRMPLNELKMCARHELY
jgi:hypothetical protein